MAGREGHKDGLGRTLTATSLAHFVNDGTSFFVPVMAALLTTDRGFSTLEIALTFAIFYASSSLMSPYVGRMGDRSGRLVDLLALGMALLGAGLIGFYLSLAVLTGASGIAAALASSLVLGVGVAFYHPLGATILQRSTDRASLGNALGINGAMGSLGRALYPLFYFLAGLAIVATGSILAFAAVGFVSAGIILMAVSPKGADRGTPHGGPPPKMRQALTRGIVLLTAFTFVRFIATQGIVAWLPTYMLVDHVVGNASLMGLLVTLIYAGGVLGQPLYGKLTKFADTRWLLGSSAAGASLSTLGFLLASGSVAYAFLFLIGLFSFSGFPLLMTLSMDYVEQGSATLANSLVFGFGTGAGNAIGPLLVSAISLNDSAHLAIGFYAMIALGLASAVAVVAMPKGGTAAMAPLFT